MSNERAVDEFVELIAQMNDSLRKLNLIPTSEGKAVKQKEVTFDVDNDPLELDLTPSPSISSSGSIENDVQAWLSSACEQYVHEKSNEAALGFDELRQTIVDILQSGNDENELQSTLADILGFDHLDLVIELIQRREAIVNSELELVTLDSDSKYNLMTENELDQRRKANQAALAEKAAKLEFGVTDPKFPHVYRQHEAGNTLSAFGTKYSLPAGTTRNTHDDYEEVIIPYPKAKSSAQYVNKLVEISSLDSLCRGTFHKYQALNKMQSLVYPVGYQTNENMLVCAPTGAGKTDVALLTMLNTIKQNSVEDPENPGVFDVNYDEFKIIYVAPLKALAAEVVEKMGQRLAWLGISVRELTGDMQLTKAEISATQVIVTTPEKWDVVTRKSTGDNELVQKVKLLIIDEVHLLHEDRGAVIESLVARTLRQVESTQSMIRIVGLSATLPNFVDVADFLRVNPQAGLFYFDSSFRPVPLEQIFVGIRGKAGSKQAMENIDRVTYDKLIDMLQQGYQVMVFVHSRKDTIKTARTFMRMAQMNGDMGLFDSSEEPAYAKAEREMSKWKNKDMKELFKGGFSVHHAGMLRAERSMSEKLFMEGAIRVLCCTATLAWGVNLPAAVVIVKGTQVYDSKKGGFVDLGITDVIQIFGRAGRPQFEKFGTGILCTTSDRLSHYLAAITQQHPIESQLMSRIADNLNAEIALGTVTNVDEGVQWLGYTYLHVRMRKNPLAYGMNWTELTDDPLLSEKRRKLIIEAARRLQLVQMIIFDENTGSFVSKDTGRVASDYYLLNSSVEVFNTMMNPLATEADIFAMLSMSGEFDSIKAREEEAKELTELRDNHAPCQIAGGLDSPQAKTNVLLQAYISKVMIQDSALFSDAAYVGQNATRISRALFLIALNRRWGRLARMLLSICKSIEKRLWSFEHPLAQFDLPQPVLRNLEEKNSNSTSIYALKDLETREIGDLVHNHRIGGQIARYVDRFPLLNLEASIAPVTKNVLRVHLEVEADFVWDYQIHGKALFFWIWVEDSDSYQVLHVEKFILSKSKLEDPHVFDFTIPLSDPLPPQIVVRALSDTWAGSESTIAVSFQHLIRPDTEPIQTKLLKLHPLPISVLHDSALERIYEEKFQYFNPMQTMIFNTLYHQSTNVLLGSPTGSGKTVAAEFALWWAFRTYPRSKVVYIAPMKALVRERVDDWRERLLQPTGRKLVELTGDSSPDAESIREADIIVTTPEKFDGISRNWQTRKFVQQVSLIIMDEIHLLASDRGPILEMIVSRMNFVSSKTKQPIRLLGMSTAVANAGDMASWLDVKDEGLFNFPSSVRPVPLQMYIDGFPNMAFCPLMKTMNKPAFLSIKSHSPTKPVLVFVASRRQTRLTAEDFIHLCGMEDNPRRFLKMSDNELEQVLSLVKDDTLKLSLQFGIGLHHAGLVDGDRKISHELFAANKIQILIATSTLAWGVNLPAHLVIIKGTQFYDYKILGYRDMELTDVLQMMGRAGRPAFDTSGIAMVYTKEATKSFYKYFLNSGFPVESSLHKMLEDHLGAEISAGTIKTKQEALDFLTWTFLFRRIHKNPTYYGIEDPSDEGINKWIIELVDKTMDNLAESGCLTVYDDDTVEPTPFLNISSYYYMSNKTIRLFLQRMGHVSTMEDCLSWLCLSTEYDELPWRHNEDLVNAEMSKVSRYSAEPMAAEVRFGMIDPHVKSYLLIQAFLTRTALPLPDYIQDRVSILDQSLRILQAAIDTVAELGYLATCLRLITLMQCIKQACWDTDDPVTTLPGLKLAERKPDVMTTLNELGTLKGNKLESVVRRLKVPPLEIGNFKRVVTTLPVIDLKIEGLSELGKDDDEIKFKITMTHLNKPNTPDHKMYTPLFQKVQKESWFVIVGISGDQVDEILLLRRVSPRKGVHNNRMECEISVPKTASEKGKVVLYCINDAMDIKYERELVL